MLSLMSTFTASGPVLKSPSWKSPPSICTWPLSSLFAIFSAPVPFSRPDKRAVLDLDAEGFELRHLQRELRVDRRGRGVPQIFGNTIRAFGGDGVFRAPHLERVQGHEAIAVLDFEPRGIDREVSRAQAGHIRFDAAGEIVEGRRARRA